MLGCTFGDWEMRHHRDLTHEDASYTARVYGLAGMRFRPMARVFRHFYPGA